MMKKVRIVIFLMIVLISYGTGNVQANHTRVENILKNGAICELKDMHQYLQESGESVQYTSQVFSATLKSEQQEEHVVIKVHDHDNLPGELIAYRFSQQFKIGHVPPIVIRKVRANFGSGQEEKECYVSLFINKEFPTPAEIPDLKRTLASLDQNEVANYKIFNFLLGNTDLYADNILFNKRKGRIVPILIDNDDLINPTFVTDYGEMPYKLRTYCHWNQVTKVTTQQEFLAVPDELATATTKAKIVAKYQNDLHFPHRDHRFKIIDDKYLYQLISEYDQEVVKELIYPQLLPEATREKLELINETSLQELFRGYEDYPEVNQLTKGILERKRMILEHFAK